MADTTTPTLPTEAATALKQAYKEYAKAVSGRSEKRVELAVELARIANLGREANWSMRALSEPLGVTPERLRQIIAQYQDQLDAPPSVTVSFPTYEPPRRATPQPSKKARVHLTEAEAKRLQELAPLAKKNTGSRPLNSKYRAASEEFSKLIMDHHDNGVIWEEISDATRPWTSWPIAEEDLAVAHQAEKDEDPINPLRPEHTISGLRMRAARHGYNKGAPPSLQRYRGIVREPNKKSAVA